MISIRRRAWSCLLLGSLLTHALHAADANEAAISQVLSQPLLPVNSARHQLELYLEARVPELQLPATRDAWLLQAAELREEFLNKVVLRGEAREWRDAPANAQWLETLDEGHGYRISKLRYEALPGFWLPALLYEPTELEGRVPMVLNPNGHDREGKAARYKQLRCINLAKRGMLALSLEFINMGQLRDKENSRHNRLVQLDLCGTSGVAPFHLALSKALDIALAHEHADPHRVGIAGLSGGGWQSIWLSALDTRIALSNPVAGYCSVAQRIHHDNNIGDAEQLASDMCTVADFTHFTAMVAPRPLLLTYNAQDDCCFVPDKVLEPLAQAGRSSFRLCEAEERFQIHINEDPGTHNFEQDNREAFYRFLNRQLLPAEMEKYDLELDVADEEIKTADELHVPLPTENLTLHTLALQLSESLPREARIPPDASALSAWRTQRRAQLRQLLRQPDYQATAQALSQLQSGNLRITNWKFKLGSSWTVPAVEFCPPAAKQTCILISDGGKQSLAAEVENRLEQGWRVLAVDLLGFGESDPNTSPEDHDDVVMILLATLGERPLGILAAQLTAIAECFTAPADDQPPTLVAIGPRSSVVAIVSAASSPEASAEVELHEAWKSIREMIRLNLRAEDAPELFCFGLLEYFDFPQLQALAQQPVTIPPAASPAASTSP